jgi:regulator of protease activity HflC (stomatin/prohibitin superfamily)
MDLITPLVATAGAAAAFGIAFAGYAFRKLYVSVDPDEFVVHYRNGNVVHLGRGQSFFQLPFDTYLKVPGTLRDVNFCADQITLEKQGVRVQGFLAYKIEDFERAYQALDFKSHYVRQLPSCEENAKKVDYKEKNELRVVQLDPEDPLAKTDFILRQLAESVVRNEVANKTLEQVTKQRDKLVESMRQQMMDTVQSWGISIDTIEFTEVWIRSKEVFQNLQAEDRNRLRLIAEISTHATAQQIAEKRLESERTVAALESEAERVRRIALSEAQLEAAKVEIENTRQQKERVLEAEAALSEIDRQRKHNAAVKDAALQLERKLMEEKNRLAAQQREHEVALDQRQKLELLKMQEAETLRRLAEAEARKAIEQAELVRQKMEVQIRQRIEEEDAKAKMRLAVEQSESEARRIASEARAARIIRIAEATRKAALEAAEGTRATGAADAEVLSARVNAENQVNARQIQRLLVAEIGKMAEKMKVEGVNWVNISGNADESPLGIIPKNVLQTLAVFKGMGVGLGDILTEGKSTKEEE